ncbi:amino acid ABC transporter permease [Anaerotignum lactatifermentans]|uniref:Amino acid ABC transporter permease n=1 Tax=Anaerotignum lactatifermentans TaxID=160404 RepID=A0ABS2G9N9_9FIRM|nr:amino acid ABC transporter permease [Anaerotignum lactatifermentans]MBM6828312.1 amino acid ABC transporter permease [Anaerotignum lactatifermentans]MBM6877592.1 amino acid ABC transporter permease [Anaerotignum lactatifermentans]MBM6949895.1 amino acid ABC transporter permease [Anaerotignum lactatifermentans]
MNFIADDRWKYLRDGLVVTLQLTFCAVLIGIVIGVVIAMIRSTHDKNINEMHKGLGSLILKFLNFIAKVYLTVIRGTPVVVQLMIMYYIILASSSSKLLVGTIAFGINSGAYVAEIVRSGIMSVDQGQFEAGRSLGFNYVQTMRYIIIPQALKTVLPTLANEFIVLLKETSVAGYIAMQDLTKGGDIIRGATFSPYMPLFAVALIYLAMVMFFTFLVNRLERRLRNSER